ncbi:MAG: hypothetical protein JXR96_09440 [Deltaproteobacteria bacterium]|nr:hypothetical protein [Deltaproteobacteria bacterium]
MSTRTVVFLTLAVLCAAGCGPKLIPGLDVELADTPDHRALLDLMASFRKSYESKDIDSLVGLASERFFEDCGSPDAADDYGYEGLRKHFDEHFKRIKKIQLNLSIKNVRVEKDSATIDYHYVTRYLMDLPAGEQWKITDELNRMELAREGGAWKVTSGM